MGFLIFSLIFTEGIKAKFNELESESDIFPQNEGKVGKSELTPVVKALTNCALDHWTIGPLHSWLRPLQHGSIQICQLCPHFEGKCHFHFFILLSFALIL